MSLKENLMQAARELAGEEAQANESKKTAEAPKTERQPVEIRRFRADGARSAAKASQATRIGTGTVIEGSVRTDDDLALYGEIHGGIVGQGDLTLSGRIEGDVEGRNIVLENIFVKGNVSAKESLLVDEYSTVEGDIHTGDFTLNGLIRGDVAASGVLTMRENAVINGSVTAGMIEVSEGAVILGNVKIGSDK